MTQEAYCKLQAMSEDEANRMIHEARLKARRDEYSRIRGARQERLQETVQKLKAMGVPIEQILLGDPVEKIAQATGLPVDEIAAL
jgi:hypothetical protein